MPAGATTVAVASDDIKLAEEYYEKCDLVKKNRFNFKFLMPISVVVSMIIILIFLLIPNNNNNYTALLLEINPKVIFTLDDENIVTNVVSVNSDADVILSDDNRLEEMINKKAEDALVIFTEYAYKMGYLNDDSNTIKLSSCGNENISNVVVNNIEQFLSNNHLFTVVYNEEDGYYHVCEQHTTEEGHVCDTNGAYLFADMLSGTQWNLSTLYEISLEGKCVGADGIDYNDVLFPGINTCPGTLS